MRLNLGICKVYPVCSSDVPRMTFDLFTAQSNFCPSFFGNAGRILRDICRYAMSELWPIDLLCYIPENMVCHFFRVLNLVFL